MRRLRLPTRHSPGLTLFLFTLFALVYCAVSGSFAPGELAYASAIGATATLLTLSAMRLADMEQRVRFAWLRHLLRPCANVLLQFWPMTRALVIALAGGRRIVAEIARRRFDPGESEGAEDRGRRALVTLGISISPASLVLNRDVDCDHLTIARVGIPEASDALDRRWPI